MVSVTKNLLEKKKVAHLPITVMILFIFTTMSLKTHNFWLQKFVCLSSHRILSQLSIRTQTKIGIEIRNAWTLLGAV